MSAGSDKAQGRYTLHGYFRSSATYRVRIGLNLKGIPYETAPVHLLNDGGEQYSAGYKTLNPMSEVPTLVVTERRARHGASVAIAQSVAILEFLEEAHPAPALLPTDALERARVRQLVESVNSSIQPIQNLKVMKRLSAAFGTDRARNFAWAKYWIDRGFEGLEGLLATTAGKHAFGDTPTLAEAFIVPQAYNARRFECDMSRYPTIARVVAAAEALPEVAAAAPHLQPDAPPDLEIV